MGTFYPNNFLKYLEAILFTAFIYLLGYKGIRQPTLFYDIKPSEEGPQLDLRKKNETSLISAPSKKYEKSGIAKEKIESILYKLKKAMEDDKLYKNELLTLSHLASSLNIPSHHLTQVLNEHLKENFYDYISRYRVEEVKVELLNPLKNNLTIFGIALDAGFNSKASFNKAFKKYVGMTHSAYKLVQMNNGNKSI